MASKIHFTPIRESSDSCRKSLDSAESSKEQLLADEGQPKSYDAPNYKPKIFWIFVVVILCLVSSITTGVSVFFWSRHPKAMRTDNTNCLEQQSYSSPALKDVDPVYLNVRFNGTLDYPSEYRGKPGLELDAAWDRLENVKVMSISEQDLVKSGYPPDSVQIPDSFGGGYMASLEVNHQLHCLNFLRKALHRDYYEFKSPEFTDKPEMIQTHLDHCLEMLRQNLMCHADVGVIAHRWVKHYPNPYPDFNVMHKCRDFEQVLQWAYDHEIPNVPSGHRWHPQEGDKIWDSPP